MRIDVYTHFVPPTLLDDLDAFSSTEHACGRVRRPARCRGAAASPSSPVSVAQLAFTRERTIVVAA